MIIASGTSTINYVLMLVVLQVHGVHRHLPAVLPAGLDQRRHHRHRLPPLSLLHHRPQNYSQYQEETGGSSNHFWLDQRWIFIFFINESDLCIKRVISRSHKSHFLSSIEILIFLFCTMDHGRMEPLVEALTLILQGGQNQNDSCTVCCAAGVWAGHFARDHCLERRRTPELFLYSNNDYYLSYHYLEQMVLGNVD